MPCGRLLGTVALAKVPTSSATFKFKAAKTNNLTFAYQEFSPRSERSMRNIIFQFNHQPAMRFPLL
jgi:hypothetical protein